MTYCTDCGAKIADGADTHLGCPVEEGDREWKDYEDELAHSDHPAFVATRRMMRLADEA